MAFPAKSILRCVFNHKTLPNGYKIGSVLGSDGNGSDVLQARLMHMERGAPEMKDWEGSRPWMCTGSRQATQVSTESKSPKIPREASGSREDEFCPVLVTRGEQISTRSKLERSEIQHT